MTNRHRQKYISRLLIGLGFVTAGLLVIFYMSLLRPTQEEWYLWAFGVVVLINGGLLCLGSAVVHKVKSDLIRKQKHKDQQKKYEFE
ncbi:MAG: hypothetical protein JNK14_09045 [Chitinophagaceae bacterium]|nr:hypothetical protein [Chitinophagaceae bacterium]